MTTRDRILKILQGEKPDQVPWCADLDYWANSLVKRGLKPQGFIQSAEYIEWHRELNVGFYLQGYFPYKQIIKDCEVFEWKEGHKRYTEINTTLGSVRECWEYIPASYTEGPLEHFLKTEEDLPILKHIMKMPGLNPIMILR